MSTDHDSIDANEVNHNLLETLLKARSSDDDDLSILFAKQTS